MVLTEIFRQARDGSGAEDIAEDSHRVNAGLAPRRGRPALLVPTRGRGADPGADLGAAPNGAVGGSAVAQRTSDAAQAAPNGVVALPGGGSARAAADAVLRAVEELVCAPPPPPSGAWFLFHYPQMVV